MIQSKGVSALFVVTSLIASDAVGQTISPEIAALAGTTCRGYASLLGAANGVRHELMEFATLFKPDAQGKFELFVRTDRGAPGEYLTASESQYRSVGQTQLASKGTALYFINPRTKKNYDMIPAGAEYKLVVRQNDGSNAEGRVICRK